MTNCVKRLLEVQKHCTNKMTSIHIFQDVVGYLKKGCQSWMFRSEARLFTWKHIMISESYSGKLWKCHWQPLHLPVFVCAQLVPENPGAQVQVYPLPLCWHVPPFKQGVVLHGLPKERTNQYAISFFIPITFCTSIMHWSETSDCLIHQMLMTTVLGNNCWAYLSCQAGKSITNMHNMQYPTHMIYIGNIMSCKIVKKQTNKQKQVQQRKIWVTKQIKYFSS